MSFKLKYIIKIKFESSVFLFMAQLTQSCNRVALVASKKLKKTLDASTISVNSSTVTSYLIPVGSRGLNNSKPDIEENGDEYVFRIVPKLIPIKIKPIPPPPGQIPDEGGPGSSKPPVDDRLVTSVDDLPAQCSEYKILDEADRNVNHAGCFDDDGKNKIMENTGMLRGWICYGDEEGRTFTSAQWKGEGYYRIMEPAGTQLPEYAPGRHRCGAGHTGWLNGKHPDDIGVEVNMTVCIDGDRDNERDCVEKYDITVTKCKGYYVYFLPDLINIERLSINNRKSFFVPLNKNQRYCGVNPE